MPKGGHNKKQNSLRLLEGREATNSPQTTPIFPHEPPEGTPEFAAWMWREYAPKLERVGVLRETDYPAWEVLCLTYETIKQAEREIQEKGVLVPGKRGEELVRNPAVSILNQARQQFRLQCQQFALDPMSRERFDLADPDAPVDPMEELLSK